MVVSSDMARFEEEVSEVMERARFLVWLLNAVGESVGEEEELSIKAAFEKGRTRMRAGGYVHFWKCDMFKT